MLASPAASLDDLFDHPARSRSVFRAKRLSWQAWGARVKRELAFGRFAPAFMNNPDQESLTDKGNGSTIISS
jgi:hypothetical protein